jgi:hypothetical protein
MKKTFKNVALLTALSLVAVSCQKEDVLPIIGTEQTADSIYVVYSINGEVYHATLSESEWDAFMERMLALARDGYEVTFSKNRTSLTSQSKEKVTFVTNSKEEAYSWSSAMIDQGYTVSITYNQSTGEYTCIAIK